MMVINHDCMSRRSDIFVLNVANYTPKMLSMALCAALGFFCKTWHHVQYYVSSTKLGNQAGFNHIAQTSHNTAPGS
jgi:hypothetical protein